MTTSFSSSSSSSTSTTPPPVLDHIVVLLPHQTLQALPPWLTDAFTLAPGGRHADGLTENKLILFRDGVYLELISFVPPSPSPSPPGGTPRQQEDDDDDDDDDDDGRNQEGGGKGTTGRSRHRWGARREGHIIDWANTLPREADLEVVRARVAGARTGVAYAAPQPGGRTRPDGVELRWVTCSPELRSSSSSSSGQGQGFVGGEAPFWCLDRTPRALRVPYQEGALTRHPCGALGVRGVSVFVRDGALFRMLKGTYDALQGQEGANLDLGSSVGGGGDEEGFSWDLHVPAAAEVGGADRETQGRRRRRTLSLIKTGGDDDAAAAAAGGSRGDVYVKLSLFTSASSGRIGGPLGDEKWVVEFDLVGSSS